MIRLFAASFAAFCLLASPSLAQNVSSVFGPNVDQDDHEAEFRIGAAPNSQDEWRYNSRLHYQRALNDSVRLRGIIQYTKPANGDLELRFIQGELLWQFLEETPGGHVSAFRFDARLAEGDNTPHQFGANWTHQWSFGEGWRLRGIALLDVDLGPGRSDGVFVGARSSLTRRLPNGLRTGVEYFGEFGNTEAGFGSFDQQEHSVGPMLSGPLNDKWGWYAGVQIGVSDGANDQDWQFTITREF
ncbi:hypothetical protein [Hyphobacterium sp.]|uniref:hypothetical protein n=1 Tax=Hyphobacterium sp. TaxID=2004662 RepID=UPI003BAB76DE